MSEEKESRVKGFFKGIANQLVEIQPDEPKQAAVQQPTIPMPQLPAAAEGEESAPVIDDGLLEKLGTVIEENDIPGPDYVELLKLANGKDEKTGEFVMAGDEATRYSTAFRAIKLMNPNFSKEIVLNSIDTYVRILDSERAGAMDELQEMWNRDVAAPESELAKTETEIDELKKRLNELTATATLKREAVEKSKVDIQNKRSRFENTFNVFKGRLVSDKEKLSNIL